MYISLHLSAVLIMLIHALSIAICFVLTTFPRILHLLCLSSRTCSDVAYKMCNDLSFPPFFKTRCLSPLQSAEDTIPTTCYSTHDLLCVSRDAYSTRTLTAWCL